MVIERDKIQKRLNVIAEERRKEFPAAERIENLFKECEMCGRRLDTILQQLYGKAGREKPNRKNAYTLLAVEEKEKLAASILSTKSIDSAIGFLRREDKAPEELRKNQKALEELLEKDGVLARYRWQAAAVLVSIYCYSYLYIPFNSYALQSGDSKRIKNCLNIMRFAGPNRSENGFYTAVCGNILYNLFRHGARSTEQFELLSSETRECYQGAYEAFRSCEKELPSLGLSCFASHGDADKSLKAEWEINYLWGRIQQNTVMKEEMERVVATILSHHEGTPSIVYLRKESLKSAFSWSADRFVDLTCLEKEIQREEGIRIIYKECYRNKVVTNQNLAAKNQLSQYHKTHIRTYCENNDPRIGKYPHLWKYCQEEWFYSEHEKLLISQLDVKRRKSDNPVTVSVDKSMLDETLRQMLESQGELANQLEKREKEEIKNELRSPNVLKHQLETFFERMKQDKHQRKKLQEYKDILYDIGYIDQEAFGEKLQEHLLDDYILNKVVDDIWNSLRPGVSWKLDVSLLSQYIDDYFRIRKDEEKTKRRNQAKRRREVERRNGTERRKMAAAKQEEEKDVKEYFVFMAFATLAICIFGFFNFAVNASDPVGRQAFVINVVIQCIVIGMISLKLHLREDNFMRAELTFIYIFYVIYINMALVIMKSPLSSHLYILSDESESWYISACICEMIVYAVVGLAANRYYKFREKHK